MTFIEGTDKFQSQLLDFFAFDNLISNDLLALNTNNVKALVPKPKTSNSTGNTYFTKDKLLESNNNYKADSSLYKLRKALVEHPFGTIKRSLGLSHVFVKGLDRVSSWASSVFLAYNLKRVINIIGIPKLIQVFSTN